MNRRMMILIIFSLALHFAVLGALTVSMKTQDFALGSPTRIETLALEFGSSASPSTRNQPSSQTIHQQRSNTHVEANSTKDSSVNDSSSESDNKTTQAAAGGSKRNTQTIGSAGPVTIGSADPYYSEVRARIQSHVTYTPSLARRRLQGQVQVALTLLSNGGIASLDIEKSSGSSDLDRLALESVRASAPFPTFQSQSSARKLELPIDFRLH